MQRKRNAARRWLALALLCALPLAVQAQQATGDANGANGDSTADHTRFEALQGPFATGPDVTDACLECHTEASKQIHTTQHWTWEYENPETGQLLGKRHVVNNFCIATASNVGFCSACHIGYGLTDEGFDFASERNVDCLVCHDTTSEYTKLQGFAGHPVYEEVEWPPGSGKMVPPVDLTKVAQNVGPTSRESCGSCHFYGGGGNAVKHGDLDSSLANPQRYLDVHMESDGLDFRCSTCHLSDAHEVSGSRYNPTVEAQGTAQLRGNREPGTATTCRSCHGSEPHVADVRLDEHTDKLACQTCHIPAFARGPLHTKMSWDWSTSGKLDENGKRFVTPGSTGRAAYDSNKGDFTYDRYVIPNYKWFNGRVDYVLYEDKIDPESVVEINRFDGGPDDPDARIWPVKTHTGKQPYDSVNRNLVAVHTAGKDDAAYWGNYDWDKAITAGMAATGVPYSGEYDFVATEMHWPITHMVAPKEDALRCADCHRDGGRLEGIEGIYLPGRDRWVLLDTAGGWLALLTLIGVLLHGAGRYAAHRRGRK